MRKCAPGMTLATVWAAIPSSPTVIGAASLATASLLVESAARAGEPDLLGLPPTGPDLARHSAGARWSRPDAFGPLAAILF